MNQFTSAPESLRLVDLPEGVLYQLLRIWETQYKPPQYDPKQFSTEEGRAALQSAMAIYSVSLDIQAAINSKNNAKPIPSV